MYPAIATFDKFFENIEQVSNDILSGEFKDIQNPLDGVTYPSINEDIPSYIFAELLIKLSQALNEDIVPVVMFARATTKNTPEAPHKIHSDKIMAQYSAHVYLSKEWPDGSGTSFWAHKTEGGVHLDSTDAETIKKDQNSQDNWTWQFTCQGFQNRILIHNACFFHRADPVGGWGETPKDGRVVLTLFFNIEPKGE